MQGGKGHSRSSAAPRPARPRRRNLRPRSSDPVQCWLGVDTAVAAISAIHLLWAWTTDTPSTWPPKKDSKMKMNHLVARLRVRALGMATRLVPAPTPFMFTGPGSSTQLVRMIADRGARSALVVTDAVLLELKVVDPVLVALEEAGIKAQVFSDVEPDPTIDVVMDGVARLREFARGRGARGGRGLADRRGEGYDRLQRERLQSGRARRLFQSAQRGGSVLRHPNHRGHGIRGHGRLGHFRSGGEAQIRDRRQQARSGSHRARSEPHDWSAAWGHCGHRHGRAHPRSRIVSLDARHAGNPCNVVGCHACYRPRPAPGVRGRAGRRRAPIPRRGLLPSRLGLHQGERGVRSCHFAPDRRVAITCLMGT